LKGTHWARAQYSAKRACACYFGAEKTTYFGIMSATEVNAMKSIHQAIFCTRRNRSAG
jgi:hypothetical protein